MSSERNLDTLLVKSNAEVDLYETTETVFRHKRISSLVSTNQFVFEQHLIVDVRTFYLVYKYYNINIYLYSLNICNYKLLMLDKIINYYYSDSQFEL